MPCNSIKRSGIDIHKCTYSTKGHKGLHKCGVCNVTWGKKKPDINWKVSAQRLARAILRFDNDEYATSISLGSVQLSRRVITDSHIKRTFLPPRS